METVHNPDRFMADLRQILSQGRKRIALLVGAGATMAIKVNDNGRLDPQGHPIIPGVDQLTQLVIQGLEHQAQRTAAETLLAELGPKSNIEAVLSRVRLLERAIGTTRIHGLDSAGYQNLATAICRQIGKIVDARLPPDRNAYNELVAWVSRK